MKTKIILLAALLSSPLSFANNVHDVDEYCAGAQELSATIMGRRQEGHLLSDMMKISNNKLAQNIVLDAYSRPQYSTKDNQMDEIIRFSNKWVLGCYKALSVQ